MSLSSAEPRNSAQHAVSSPHGWLFVPPSPSVRPTWAKASVRSVSRLLVQTQILKAFKAPELRREEFQEAVRRFGSFDCRRHLWQGADGLVFQGNPASVARLWVSRFCLAQGKGLARVKEKSGMSLMTYILRAVWVVKTLQIAH